MNILIQYIFSDETKFLETWNCVGKHETSLPPDKKMSDVKKIIMEVIR